MLLLVLIETSVRCYQGQSSHDLPKAVLPEIAYGRRVHTHPTHLLIAEYSSVLESHKWAIQQPSLSHSSSESLPRFHSTFP